MSDDLISIEIVPDIFEFRHRIWDFSLAEWNSVMQQANTIFFFLQPTEEFDEKLIVRGSSLAKTWLEGRRE